MWNDEASDANNKLLDRTIADLTYDQWRTFAAHLIGGLSGYVQPESYARACAEARKFTLRDAS